jgi:hypothetical protein
MIAGRLIDAGSLSLIAVDDPRETQKRAVAVLRCAVEVYRRHLLLFSCLTDGVCNPRVDKRVPGKLRTQWSADRMTDSLEIRIIRYPPIRAVQPSKPLIFGRAGAIYVPLRAGRFVVVKRSRR